MDKMAPGNTTGAYSALSSTTAAGYSAYATGSFANANFAGSMDSFVIGDTAGEDAAAADMGVSLDPGNSGMTGSVHSFGSAAGAEAGAGAADADGDGDG